MEYQSIFAKQKWENFAQIEETVYPDLVKGFYKNAYMDYSQTWIKNTVGCKEVHLTQESIAESLEILTIEKKIYAEA